MGNNLFFPNWFSILPYVSKENALPSIVVTKTHVLMEVHHRYMTDSCVRSILINFDLWLILLNTNVFPVMAAHSDMTDSALTWQRATRPLSVSRDQMLCKRLGFSGCTALSRHWHWCLSIRVSYATPDTYAKHCAKITEALDISACNRTSQLYQMMMCKKVLNLSSVPMLFLHAKPLCYIALLIYKITWHGKLKFDIQATLDI